MRTLPLVAGALLAAVWSSSHAQTLGATTLLTGRQSPVALVRHPSDAQIQFLVEQNGVVRVVVNGVLRPTPFLNISSIVSFSGENGLLGLAFPPDYATSRYFYVNFRDKSEGMQIARYSRSVGDQYVADPNSRFNILRTSRSTGNHNGGTMHFNADGKLYVAMGDGANPLINVAQSPQSLLGKIIRIDPTGDDFPTDPARNYKIPPDNPFVNGQPISALGEIWSFGTRNPWKFSFDDTRLFGNGAMIFGDVGEDRYEEINYEPYRKGGANYGWPLREGFATFKSGSPAYEPLQSPTYVYGHATGQSVVGGYVYRGLQLGPEYFGRYFFGDFAAGKLWSMVITYDQTLQRYVGRGLREHTADFAGIGGLGSISSIDMGYDGELYLCDYSGGRVLKLNRPNSTWLSGLVNREGTIIRGSLRHVLLRDNVELVLRPNLAARRSIIDFVGNTNRANPTALDVDLVGRYGIDAKATLRVMLKRWSDGEFVQVSAFNMDGVSRRFRVTGLPAGTYVRGSDGRVEVRAQMEVKGAIATSAFVYWDQVVITAR
ncbi:MAG: PQQ-dependent sugar dehydrogenase [Fimbriimonadaceae bacterium]|nr:PQQ-dependent sugar dehydrogenase [Fimbriimonadaceae bacterium]QYK55573.1 MAG: PQQ-dependent sugar dehydrogenase [Fimbriimonadaceae bacterium]